MARSVLDQFINGLWNKLWCRAESRGIKESGPGSDRKNRSENSALCLQSCPWQAWTTWKRPWLRRA